jgi:hypothetical protein
MFKNFLAATQETLLNLQRGLKVANTCNALYWNFFLVSSYILIEFTDLHKSLFFKWLGPGNHCLKEICANL